MASKRNPKPRRNATRTAARRARRQRFVAAGEGNRMVSGVTFNPDGSRTVHLSDEGQASMWAYMTVYREQFVATWGREPGPEDPLFPDWDAPYPAPLSVAKMEAEAVEVFEEAGVSPELIYAFQQAGVMVTEHNRNIADPGAVAEFDAAVARYRRLHATVD